MDKREEEAGPPSLHDLSTPSASSGWTGDNDVNEGELAFNPQSTVKV